MIRVLAVLVVLALAPPAMAVTVDSGEHADFSRIVLRFADAPDWQFGRVPGGYEFRPDGPNPDYRLDTVFRFIPRTRIADIEIRAGRLFLAVDCACHADAFEIRQGVVIDIKDGPAPRSARFEQPLPADDVPPDQAAASPSDTPVPDLTLPFDVAPRRTELAWRDPLAVTLPEPRIDTIATRDPASDRATALSEAQRALAEQIGRAATQGLVEIRQPESPAPAPPPESVGAPPPEQPVPDALPGLGARPNLRVETAVDRARPDGADRPPQTANGGECLADSRLDVHDWGAPPDRGRLPIEARARLVDAFDDPDPESATQLARAYVYLTFGAEARNVIETFAPVGPDEDLLLRLAEIVDDGHASDPGPLAGQGGCDTAAALWAVLAQPDVTPGQNLDRAAIIQAFSLLPLHLRRHLGPGLGDRFRRAGDADTAAAIRNAIARAPGDAGPGFDMLEAQIALDDGDLDAGIDRLESLMAADGATAPAALEVLVAALIDAGDAVPDPLIETAAALAFEHRGTPRAAALEEMRLRALVQNARFAEALADIDAAESAAVLDPVTLARLRQLVLERITDEAPDPAFLKVALRLAERLGTGPDTDALRQSVAKRLLDLGLTEPARRLLDPMRGRHGPAHRQLLARADLADGRGNRALDRLAGLDTPDAARLRAKALEQGAENRRAARLYAEIGDADAEARATWRGRDWTGAAVNGRPEERRAAELLVDAPGARQDGPPDNRRDVLPTLARAVTMVDAARDARIVLDALLAATPLP